MLLSKKGSIHKMVVGSVIFCGFGVALILPQYKKHETLVKARTAAERVKEIAFLLEKNQRGVKPVTPDFAQIELSFACERNEDNTQLSCDDYTYRFDNGNLLRIEHNTLPQWFEIDVENGTVACESEKGSWAGEHICNHAHVPSAL